MTLEFAGGALLHVPTTKIDLVQKYIGGFHGRPPLSHLGGKRWARQKEQVADAVKAELAEIRNHPDAEGLDLRIYRDSSEDVRNGLGQLASAGAIGGLLAIVFLYLFLRKFRTTLLIGLAIPISIVLTFVIMYLLRQAHLSTITINIMSLMGLMLALGMLVDNSVVVIESRYTAPNWGA